MSNKSELCLSCLECCKYISHTMRFSGNMSPYEEFCNLRELEIVGVDNGIIYIRIEKPCKYLTPAGCSIYDSRPSICRVYDGTKDKAMLDKCRWEDR